MSPQVVTDRGQKYIWGMDLFFPQYVLHDFRYKLLCVSVSDDVKCLPVTADWKDALGYGDQLPQFACEIGFKKC